MVASFKLISNEEHERLIAEYWRDSVSYEIGYMDDGLRRIPVLILDDDDIILNEDNTITWATREIGFTMHSFIELTTGEGEQSKTVYIPLCLVNPASRRGARVLIEATRDPESGKYGSRPAEIMLLSWTEKTLLEKGFKDVNKVIEGAMIEILLPSLSMNYVMLKLLPPGFERFFATKTCPFCRMYTENGGDVW